MDPLKQQMPVFYVAAKARYRADSATSLKQLNAYIATKNVLTNGPRVSKLNQELKAREKQLAIDEIPRKDGLLSANFLMGSLRDAMAKKNPLYMIEAVTMTGMHLLSSAEITDRYTGIVFDHLKPTAPGSVLNSGAGGRESFLCLCFSHHTNVHKSAGMAVQLLVQSSAYSTWANPNLSRQL